MDAVAQLQPVSIETPTSARNSVEARELTHELHELTVVFREYRVRLFHFALQLVGNHEDALDVTQDTFLRLHRHWHRRDPDRSLAPWLYAIARNLAIDLLRKRGTRREDDLEAAPRYSPRPGPEVLAQQNELKATVWNAINQLPEPLREVVILRDIHGFSYAEIAQTLGVPTTTVTSRLHDARQQLRRKLQRYL